MIHFIIARLKTHVPDLSGRVSGAADLAGLMKRGGLPQITPAAFVIPLGLSGGNADAASGVFRQQLTQTYGVIFTVRPNDKVGAAGLEPIQSLTTDVIAALAGWAPNDETGVFAVGRGNMINVAGGAVSWQLQFTITDQLRIIS